MNRTSQAVPADSRVTCVVCQTHSRPLYVPWQQHAVGCAIRAVELERRTLEQRPALRLVSSIAAF